MRIGTLGDGAFLQVGLENSMYKKSECKSQTKKIFGMEILFLLELNGFLHLLAWGWKNFRLLGYLISFLGEGDGEGGTANYFHRPINDESFKLKYS